MFSANTESMPDSSRWPDAAWHTRVVGPGDLEPSRSVELERALGPLSLSTGPGDSPLARRPFPHRSLPVTLRAVGLWRGCRRIGELPEHIEHLLGGRGFIGCGPPL